MRISDVVKQVRAVLPNYTDLFGDTVGIASIVASGGVATVTTNEPHRLIDGGAVTIAGVETRTPIIGHTQSGLNHTFTTGADHDLTHGWKEHIQIQLGGFTDNNWNTVQGLKESNNRQEFKVMNTLTAPVLNGGEYLLEVDRLDGINGVYSVTVINPTQFTIEGDFLDGEYTPINGSIYLNPRVASVIDIDRALEEYTKQNLDKFWLFVEPIDADVSKDRSTFSDATSTITSGQEMRTRIVDGFNCYIVAPVTDQIAGEESLDVCRHDLLLPMMRTLYGVQFDTGLSNAADFRTILNGHGVAAYNKAFLVYRYEFQVVMDLTDDDTVLPSQTRAFRNVDYTLSVGGVDTTDMTVTDLNIDIGPSNNLSGVHPVSSGMVFHLDAGSGGDHLDISGGMVNSWVDISGNSIDFSQSGDNRPQYNESSGSVSYVPNDSSYGFLTTSVGGSSAIQLPDASGSVPGVGFTCTGLFYDEVSNQLMFGNDGRGSPGDTTHEPSIVFTTITGDFVSEIDVVGVEPTATSVQGVCIDSSNDSIWFALPEQDLLINITRAGDEIIRHAVPEVNGVSYDDVNDQLVITQGSRTVALVDKVTGGVSGAVDLGSSGVSGSIDHIYYNSERGHAWVTHGVNGEDGNLIVHDFSKGVTLENRPIVGALAVEGIALIGDKLYVANDAHFHNQEPNINQVIVYDVYNPYRENDGFTFSSVYQLDSLTPTDALFTIGNPLEDNEVAMGVYVSSPTGIRVFVSDGSGSIGQVEIIVDDMSVDYSLLQVVCDFATGLVSVNQNGEIKGSSVLDVLQSSPLQFDRMQIADSEDNRNIGASFKGLVLFDRALTPDELSSEYDFFAAKGYIS